MDDDSQTSLVKIFFDFSNGVIVLLAPLSGHTAFEFARPLTPEHTSTKEGVMSHKNVLFSDAVVPETLHRQHGLQTETKVKMGRAEEERGTGELCNTAL